jgi:hypothetical protein
VVVVHDLVVLLFEVIAFVVIFLLMGLFLVVLLFAMRESDHGINLLDGNCHFVVCCNSIGCFGGSCNSCDNDASGLSHGCIQWEDEPSSFPLAASYP